MKLRKGERIVCGKGHHVGDIRLDVPDGVPVSTDALSLPSPIVPGRGYACEECDEVVAEREGENRWRVRTVRGWVA